MKYLYLCVLSFIALHSSAQLDLLDSISSTTKPKHEYVAYTFKTTRIINGHSVETVKKHALDFRVSHRFGDAFATKEDNIHNLFGFDQASDIAIIFEYGVTDDLTIGTGRMKGAGAVHELWNANIKYRVLKQTKDFKIPFTVTLFGNTAITSMLSSGDPTSIAYYPKHDYHGFADRLSYVVQAMIACKATSWLSVQLSPTFVWRNRVADDDKNGLFYLGFSARAKCDKRTAILFEYFMPLMKPGTGGREYFPMVRGIKNASYYPSIDLGVEWETGGHIFHVNFTNTAGILENDFLPYNAHNWIQGQFRLGFTISRTFQLDRKMGKYWKKGSVEDSTPTPAK